MKWRGGFEHSERRQQNRVEQMEQVEQIQDKARKCHEKELGAKGVWLKWGGGYMRNGVINYGSGMGCL